MATIDQVKIGNMALSHIGTRSTIEDFDEASAEAQHIKLWYDFCRLQVLEAYDWSFARKRLALALHSDDPPEGVWSFRYQYPSDCVRARKIQNSLAPPADADPFSIEASTDGTTRSILTDVEDAILVYTKDTNLTSIFSPQFVISLSHLIGQRIAVPLTGKRNIMVDQAGMFAASLISASASDANQMVDKPPRDVDWIRGRA